MCKLKYSLDRNNLINSEKDVDKQGVSINTFDLNGEYYPLVKGEDVLKTGGDGNKTR